ncbi:hypothetical protein [Streptomyces sp. NPDC002845]
MIAESILDPATGHFRDDLDEYAEPFGSGMLLLNSAQLARPWRGFGIGAVLAGKAIARLGAGARGAACYPSPLDRTGLADDAARDRAVSALQRTWSSLGFRPYRDGGVYVLNLATTALSEALSVLTDRIEALPQPDREEWEAGPEEHSASDVGSGRSSALSLVCRPQFGGDPAGPISREDSETHPGPHGDVPARYQPHRHVPEHGPQGHVRGASAGGGEVVVEGDDQPGALGHQHARGAFRAGHPPL